MTNPAQNKKLKLLKFIICIIGILSGGCFSPLESYKTLAECEQAFTPPDRIYLKNNEILTLADARRIALNNNPTLRSSAAAITAAKYNYDRALSAYLPAIDLNGSTGYASDSGYHLHNPPPGIMKRNNHFNAAGTLQATLLLFDGLARELEVRLAKLQYNDRTAADKNVKRLLARAVAYTYWDILLASAELEIAEADVDFQTAALKQSEIQFSSGYVSLAEVLNFKILAERARSHVQNAHYRRRIACNALTALLGYARQNFPENIRLQKISQDFTELPDEETCLEQAIRHRPDLEQERIQLETAIRQKQLVYARFLPALHFFTAYSLDAFDAKYSHYSVTDARYTRSGFSYGISGTWNIFDGFATLNQLRFRKVLEKIAVWGLNTKFLEIVNEIRDARAHYINSISQTAIFIRIVEQVKQQRNLVYSEYLNGRETIARLNQAQSICIEVQNNLALWQIQSRKAAAQLNAAAAVELLPE